MDNNDNKINILLVCGNGMGTSQMAEIIINKELNNLNIDANLNHTSFGMIESLREWADVIFVLKNFYDQIDIKPGEHIFPIVNIMGGKEMAAKVNEIVEEFYPQAKLQ